MAYYHRRVKLDRYESFELSSDMKAHSISAKAVAAKKAKAHLKDYGCGIAAQFGLIKKKTDSKRNTISDDKQPKISNNINSKNKIMEHEEKKRTFAAALSSANSDSFPKHKRRHNSNETYRDESSSPESHLVPSNVKIAKSNGLAERQLDRRKYLKCKVPEKGCASVNDLIPRKRTKQQRINVRAKKNICDDSSGNDELLASSGSESSGQADCNFKDMRQERSTENRLQREPTPVVYKRIKEKGDNHIRASSMNHRDKGSIIKSISLSGTTPLPKKNKELEKERKKRSSLQADRTASIPGPSSKVSIVNKGRKEARIYQKDQLTPNYDKSCSSSNRKHASDSPGFLKSAFFEATSASQRGTEVCRMELCNNDESATKRSFPVTNKSDSFKIPKKNKDLPKIKEESDSTKKRKGTQSYGDAIDLSEVKIEADSEFLHTVKIESDIDNIDEKEEDHTVMKINLKNNQCITRNEKTIRNRKGEDLLEWFHILNDSWKPKFTKSDTSDLNYFITLHSRFKVMETMEMNDLEVLPEDRADAGGDQPIRIFTNLSKEHYEQYLDEHKLKSIPELVVTRLFPSSLP